MLASQSFSDCDAPLFHLAAMEADLCTRAPRAERMPSVGSVLLNQLTSSLDLELRSSLSSLEPHAEQQPPNSGRPGLRRYDSFRCLQVAPSDDLLSDLRSTVHLGQEKENIGTTHSVPLASQIASSIHLTDAQLSERTAALHFILTSPAHFRQLQSDLRSSSVITTQGLSVVLDKLLSERVERMRRVREEALRKIREEREREREYARQMGIPFDDDDDEDNAGGDNSNGGMSKNAKGKAAGWDHLLAGLTSVANLGAGFLTKQSSTLSVEQHPKSPRRQHARPLPPPSGMIALQDMKSCITAATAATMLSSEEQGQERGKKPSLSTVAKATGNEDAKSSATSAAARMDGSWKRSLVARGA